jgi:DNA-binding beta-propeller fold protein YncE
MHTPTRRWTLGGLAAATALGSQAQAASATRLVFLNGMRVLIVDADGRNLTALVEPPPGQPRGSGLYDGVAYDAATKQVYWTDMGRASADDGAIQRIGVSGGQPQMLVAPGGAFTPKQMKLDAAHGKMYWSDREGMRIMRANLDGSGIEVLVQTGSGEADRKQPAHWCVGIALDAPNGKVYWTQKGADNAGQGVIRRTSLQMPRGQTPATRTDIETLFSGLPEPVDLDLDLKTRRLYWTDRGDNTVSRAPMDPPKGYDPAGRSDRQVLVRGLKEAIGIALDLKNGRMFYTDLGGAVGTARLDGSDARILLANLRPLTGIALVD